MKTIYFLAVCLLLGNSFVFSQPLSRATEPGEVSQTGIFKSKGGAVKSKNMPSIDLKKLLQEDSISDLNGDLFRFGAKIPVSIGLSEGSWEKVEGGRVWKIGIRSKKAYSINLLLDQFFLPHGDVLYIYNEDRSFIYGPITDNENSVSKSFATDVIPGEGLILELFEPEEVSGLTEINISTVVHGYKNIVQKSFGDSESCLDDNNTICAAYSAWAAQSDAVAMIISGLNRICTGTLMNNACQDYTPYILTAWHCMDSDLNGSLSQSELDAVPNWVFRFRYKSPTCSPSSEATSWTTVSGSSIKAQSSVTDFLLVQMNGAPSVSSGVKYAGWSNSSTAPTSSATIHHPKGDVMKVSLDNNAATTPTSGTPGSAYWEVGWDDGLTQLGSSGAALFDQNKRVVGQLYGGTSTCTGSGTDFYGKVSISWNGAMTDETRLSTWLGKGSSWTTTNTIGIPYLALEFYPVCYSPGKIMTLYNAPSSGSTIVWSTSSNITITGGQGTASLSFRAANSTVSGWGTVTATLTGQGTGGCTPKMFSQSIWVGKPNNASAISGSSSVYSGSSYSYSVSSAGGGAAAQYLWTWPSGWSGPSSTTATSAYATAGSSSGYVTVTPSNLCGNALSSSKYVTANACGGCRQITISPNPSEKEAFINVLSENETQEEVCDYKVFDLNGKLVAMFESVVSSDPRIINTSNLPNGIYIVHVVVNDKIIPHRLLVRR